MQMAFGNFEKGTHRVHTMAEINMIPLIDVMLVLLVIFMITAPLVTHSVKIDLPKVTSNVQQPEKEAIDISIDIVGQLFWNKEMVHREELILRFNQLFEEKKDQAQLHIFADQQTPYHFIAETLADASTTGITQISFVSQPREQ
jgi:biopolymer transport protein ExbD